MQKEKSIFFKNLLNLLFITLLLTACNDRKREQELDKREQALAVKEVEFAARAADYQSLLKMRDSLFSKKDTVQAQRWTEGIAGFWNGKTICRESDCSDYVVGDQRSATWEFAGDSSSIFTKIINQDKLVRVYSASVDSTEIMLHFATDSTAERKVDINVNLSAISSNLIRGTQTISVNNKCTARFSVELVKASNP